MLLTVSAAWAQRNQYGGTVAFDNPGGVKEGGTVILQTQINLDELKLHRQQMLTITPVLRSPDRAHVRTFAPVAASGPAFQ